MWAREHWMCCWVELPRLRCLEAVRLGKKGRRKGFRKRRREEGRVLLLLLPGLLPAAPRWVPGCGASRVPP